jgi:hypothetical protein
VAQTSASGIFQINPRTLDGIGQVDEDEKEQTHAWTLGLHATYEHTCSTNQTFNPSEVTSWGYEHDGSSMSRHDDGSMLFGKVWAHRGRIKPLQTYLKLFLLKGQCLRLDASQTFDQQNILESYFCTWPHKHLFFPLALFLFGQLWRKSLRKRYLGAFGRKGGCHQWTRRIKGKWIGLVVDAGSKEENRYDQVEPSIRTLEARTNL